MKSALNRSKLEGPDELLQGISDFLNYLHWWWYFTIGSNVCAGSLSTMETTIRTKQYGGEIILPNLTSEAGAKTYGPPCTITKKTISSNRENPFNSVFIYSLIY
jgi:hypothetical protein